MLPPIPDAEDPASILHLAAWLRAHGHDPLAERVELWAGSVRVNRALRQRALDLAVALDLRGHTVDAGAVLDEVVRRATHDVRAMGDGPFSVWLAAVEAHFGLDARGPEASG